MPAETERDDGPPWFASDDVPPQTTFRVEIPVAPNEPDEISRLRVAAAALDNLDPDQALAATEYLAARYRRLAQS